MGKAIENIEYFMIRYPQKLCDCAGIQTLDLQSDVLPPGLCSQRIQKYKVHMERYMYLLLWGIYLCTP